MKAPRSFRVRRQVTGTGPSGPALVPTDLVALYHLNRFYSRGVYGEGEEIAFIEFAPPKASDDSLFWSRYSVRSSLNQVVRTVMPQGTATDPAALGETDLDLEYAGALAPGAQLTAYVMNGTLSLGAFLPTLWNVLREIAASGTRIVSISLGAGELDCAEAAPFTDPVSGRTWPDLPAFAADLDAWIIENQLHVFVAAGDSGAYAAFPADPRVQVSWPAAQAAVVAVGGTQLAIAGAVSSGEQAWGGQDLDPALGGYNPSNTLPQASGGGGISSSVVAPSYQASLDVATRVTPDVAAFAGPLLIVDQGQEIPVWGTSAAAPITAAICALYHAATGSYLTHSALYATARDVTSGNNLNDSLVEAGLMAYSVAGPGFDACTGAGAPDAAAFPGI